MGNLFLFIGILLYCPFLMGDLVGELEDHKPATKGRSKKTIEDSSPQSVINSNAKTVNPENKKNLPSIQNKVITPSKNKIQDNQIQDKKKPQSFDKEKKGRLRHLDSKDLNKREKAKNKESKSDETAWSSQNNRKVPVIFEGEQLSGFRKLGTVELKENVKVNQGDFYLESETAKVFFDVSSDEVKKIIAVGSVKIRKVDPVSGVLVKASSRKVEFDAEGQTIKLIDDAKLKRGDDLINGQVINYDLQTGKLVASKVKGTVTPQEKKEK